jgi:hypothetical protein
MKVLVIILVFNLTFSTEDIPSIERDGEMIMNDEEVRIWKQAALAYLQILSRRLLLEIQGPIPEHNRD